MKKVLKKTLLWGPLSLAGIAFVGYLIQPWPVFLRWKNPDTTSFMRYRLKEAKKADKTLELDHEWVPLADISKNMQRAVILAEDGHFREHGGVDWAAIGEEVHYDGKPPFSWFSPGDLAAIGRGVRYYASHRDEVKGRSTITQQLAKNLYFTPARSLTRKFAEVVVAQRLEWFLSKDRILELYLNTVELGPGVFGVESAAQNYFGKSAADLTAYQAASLAGTLPHPLTSNPGYRPSRMAWRRDIIVRRMTGGSTDLTPVPVMPELPPIPIPGDSAVAAAAQPLPGDTAGAMPVPEPLPDRPLPSAVPSVPSIPPLPPDTVGVRG